MDSEHLSIVCNGGQEGPEKGQGASQNGPDGGRWHTVVEEHRKCGSSGLNFHHGCLRRKTALAGGLKVQLHSGHGRLDQHVIGENAASGGSLWCRAFGNRLGDTVGKHTQFCDMVRGSQASQEQSLSLKSVRFASVFKQSFHGGGCLRTSGKSAKAWCLADGAQGAVSRAIGAGFIGW